MPHSSNPSDSVWHFWDQSLSVPRQTSDCQYPGIWLGFPLPLKSYLCDHIRQYIQESGCLLHSVELLQGAPYGRGREEREPWAGAMDLQLKTFPSPSVEPSAVASTHVRRLKTPLTPASRDLMPSYGHNGYCTHIHTLMHRPREEIHIFKKRTNPVFNTPVLCHNS